MGKRMLIITDGNFWNASARIRALEYVPFFKEIGYKVVVSNRIPGKGTSAFNRWILFPLVKRYYFLKKYGFLIFYCWDLIYIQRHFVNCFFLRMLKRNAQVIYDFDDAIFINRNDRRAARKTQDMVRTASDVVIGSPLLEEFCLSNKKKPVFIPTPVDIDQVIPRVHEPKKTVTIGWIGSSWTSDFFDAIVPVLRNLSNEHELTLLTVGYPEKKRLDGINHINIAWKYGIEIEVLSRIDIGVMPLPDELYANAKGGYKLFLYMAGGIPCIASPVGINSEIVENNVNGYLAKSDEDWHNYLTMLSGDYKLREFLGENGRQKALRCYDRKVTFAALMKIVNKNEK
jgi:glycosyltransferase involved in cell wall biosynthesis